MSLKPVALGGAILILAAVGVGVSILKPRDLECASAETRELVSQIARENQAEMDALVMQFVSENPAPKLSQAPKSAERIAAEQRLAALQEAAAKASREAIDALTSGAPPKGPQVLGWGPQAAPRASTDASQRANQVRQELFSARKSYALAYDKVDRAARAADEKADAENRATAFESLQKQVRYTIDDVRTTDKNGAGAPTCAATLKAQAGKYSWTPPITYKVEQTSDRKLYVTVYGLKKS
jgi:hypothetical protein